MINYKLQVMDCCYQCNYGMFYDEITGYEWCRHPDNKGKEIEPIGVCDNYDDEIRGN